MDYAQDNRYNYSQQQHDTVQMTNANYQFSQLANINTNYFTIDQSKHIDYVFQFKDKLYDKNKKDKSLEKEKEIRNKFLLQLMTQEGFTFQKIVKKKGKRERIVYLLLNCTLERLMQEAQRIHLELPLKDV